GGATAPAVDGAAGSSGGRGAKGERSQPGLERGCAASCERASSSAAAPGFSVTGALASISVGVSSGCALVVVSVVAVGVVAVACGALGDGRVQLLGDGVPVVGSEGGLRAAARAAEALEQPHRAPGVAARAAHVHEAGGVRHAVLDPLQGDPQRVLLDEIAAVLTAGAPARCPLGAREATPAGVGDADGGE